MTRNKWTLALAAVLACWTIPAAASPVDVTPPEQELGQAFEYWIEPAEAQPLADVQALPPDAWTASDRTQLTNLSLRHGVWLRFSLHNPGSEPAERLLVFGTPMHPELHAFGPDGRRRSVDVHHAVRDVDVRDRFPIWRAHLEPGETQQWHIRMGPSVMLASASLWDVPTWSAQRHIDALTSGLFAGALLAILIVSLGLAWVARTDRARGFELFAVGLLANQALSQGHHIWLGEWAGPLVYAILPLQCLTLAAAMEFATSFLGLRAHRPWLHRALQFVKVSVVGCGVVAAVDFPAGVLLTAPFSALAVLGLVAAVVTTSRRAPGGALKFTVACAPLLLGIVTYALGSLDLISLAWAPSGALVAMAPLSLVFFALTLAADGVRDTVRQSSRLERQQVELQRFAFSDPLTGCANRAVVVRQITFRLERLELDPDARFGLLFLDLDRFKNVNDTFGHPVGDRMLVELAARLREGVREQDLVARLGGDEFVVLADRMDDDKLQELADRLLAAVRKPMDLGPITLRPSASMGTRLVRVAGPDAAELLSQVDLAMYAAKAAGKDRARPFDDELMGRAREQIALESDLHRALANNEIQVQFQPLVRCIDERVVGFEALARWTHPERGPIPPDVFIPVSEECGLVEELGRLVMRQSLAAVRRWNAALGANLYVSVNIAARDLAQPDFAQQVTDLLEEMDCRAPWLRLELTELSIVNDLGASQRILRELAEAGVDTALDDFGTGYSSLTYLHRLPLRSIKIDRSFVSTVTSRAESRAIVRTVVALGLELGKDVIAEGVELPEEREILEQMGCRLLQGFLTGRPEDEEDISRKLMAGELQPRTGPALSPGRESGVYSMPLSHLS